MSVDKRPEQSLLGRATEYRSDYAPELLFPIPRQQKRDELGILAGERFGFKVAAFAICKYTPHGIKLSFSVVEKYLLNISWSDFRSLCSTFAFELTVTQTSEVSPVF